MNWFEWLKKIMIKKIELNLWKKDKHTQNQTQEQRENESAVKLGIEIELKEDKTKPDNTSTPKEENKENQPGGQTKPSVVKGWNGQISTPLVLAFWLLLWAIIAIPAMYMMDWPKISKLVTWLIVLASGALTASLGYFLTYELAKRSIFVTMTPEMSAIAITYWKKLKRFYIAVSDEHKSPFFERLCELKNGKCGYKKFIFLKPRKGGLCWVGFPPANKIFEWTETEDGKKVKRALSLAETPISFPMQKEKKKEDSGDKSDNETEADTIFVPNVNTKDGIEVSASFTLYFWVLDPEKGLFGVKNRTSALAELVFAAWRKIVGKLAYYRESEDEDKKSEEATKNTTKGKKDSDNGTNKAVNQNSNGEKFTLNSDILKLAEFELQKELGLKKEPDDEKLNDHHGASNKEIAKTADVKELLELMIGNRDPDGTAARIFLKDWGMLLREIAITDLEPTDADIKLALKDILKANIKAKKTETEAEGTKIATRLQGEGEAEAIEVKAGAYAKPGGNFVAAGDIAEKLPKNTTLVSSDVGNVIGALLPKILGNKSNQDEPSIKKEEPVKETKKEPAEESKEKPKEEKKKEGSGN